MIRDLRDFLRVLEEIWAAEPEAKVPDRFWNRIGIVDLVAAGVLLYANERFWMYAIYTF